ncbi:hypothetical protein GCM10010269_41890 [Streptomyces humidus]|uniref:DUF1877 family protein n=1 Tax=Streptomyces humidus TaxID=52259 RepID=A0A918FXE9_9ACTN|nr:DUF1877 family protein [Streptomyces humidus]GGR98694.1 hypothetical protein GCM10010269_41890 [Streptomyces humidus]
MNAYLQLRAVPPSALRNSATWLRKLFDDHPADAAADDAVRDRMRRHRAQPLDGHYGDQQLLYPDAHVVLGGEPVHPAGAKGAPLVVLTVAQTARVAAFLARSDFDDLWRPASAALLPRYGGRAEETRTRAAFACAHRELTDFYTATARHRDAVVKWLP